MPYSCFLLAARRTSLILNALFSGGGVSASLLKLLVEPKKKLAVLGQSFLIFQVLLLEPLVSGDGPEEAGAAKAVGVSVGVKSFCASFREACDMPLEGGATLFDCLHRRLWGEQTDADRDTEVSDDLWRSLSPEKYGTAGVPFTKEHGRILVEKRCTREMLVGTAGYRREVQHVQDDGLLGCALDSFFLLATLQIRGIPFA